MRWILLAALAAPLPAHADLYRWVDPQSGSVKFSSVPPDWYGDPLREGIAPRVEVLRYRGPPAAKLPPTAAEEIGTLERLKKGLEPPVSPKPPAMAR